MPLKPALKTALSTLVAAALASTVTALAIGNAPANATGSGTSARTAASTASALPPGYQVVVLPNKNVPNFQRRTAWCPHNKRVIGGGGEAQGPNAVLVGSFPTSDGRGWIALGRQSKGNTVGISVYAICAL
ncbi:hypothetical protein GCM10010106_24920 [Thermopolyspora flexuosa]|jgi:hypothetical protein|uniref:Uncharacterized protein n=1 Tax=Thermopolyspora flexuosa TaxID=103836 RepID=A0A543IVL7_9ACTN|nr:hypothetical protein [Thermopolyspora flexuosa]TQM74601.1 hypothetical protein FHX40_1281 [Thermopolyspora flexuosa]GGM77482.1 hypothetical protein GCM10010106_24920 [Thermopolyspora flexuosa]